ncbi:MAG: hypothetical protein ACRDZ3_22625 [Acidimicrobiia bacterium]
MDTNPQNVRFRVIGNTIQAKLWAAGTTEPGSWSVQSTDNSVVNPGVFQANHNFSAGAHTISIDNLTVDQYSMPFEQTSVGFPPCNRWEDQFQPPYIEGNGLAWVCQLIEGWGDDGEDYYGWELATKMRLTLAPEFATMTREPTAGFPGSNRAHDKSGSNRAHDKYGNLMGWLVFADESKTTVQLIDRFGRPLKVHKHDDGTVSMTAPDGERTYPRPVKPEDPFKLDLDAAGMVIVIDGRENPAAS